jgi:predicted DCC family thiol-disulfide oxidoreductase YuxK
MIQRAWHRFVFGEYATRTENLAFYRILLGVWLLAFRVPQLEWIRGYPGEFLNPPLGLTAFFFTGFPPAWVFNVLDAVCILSLAFWVGRGTLAAAVVYTACQVIGQGWMYSFGKINHEILMVLTPLFVALAERESRSTRTGWPLALFAFSISLAMFTAAAAKAATGWLDTSASATLGHGLANALGAAARDNAAWQLATTRLPQPAWEALDWLAVLMEASFVVTVFRRPAFLLSVSVACLFHLSVSVLMRINFVNIYAYGAFVNWMALASFFGLSMRLSWFIDWLRRRTSAQIALPAVAFAIASMAWRNPATYLWTSTIGVSSSFVAIVIAATIATIYLVAFATRSVIDKTPVANPTVILFDGVCGLCNAWVDFILEADTRGRYRFVALQSDLGRSMLDGHRFPADYVESIVLVDGSRSLVRSAAILEILIGLGGLWRLAVVGRLLPARLLDSMYTGVAERRYKWFGRLDACRVPTPEERSRFIA